MTWLWVNSLLLITGAAVSQNSMDGQVPGAAFHNSLENQDSGPAFHNSLESQDPGAGVGQNSVEAQGTANAVNPPDFCSLPPDIGPCRENMQKFYFNPISSTCEQFIYGGCQGNANNFETAQECSLVCGRGQMRAGARMTEGRDQVAIAVNTTTSSNATIAVDEICLLPKRVGFCKGQILMYFYNTTSNECEQFFYGGCSGNDNRFETIEACQTKCIPVKTNITRNMTETKNGESGTLYLRHDDLENQTLDFETDSMAGWNMENMSLLIVDPTEDGSFGVFNAGEIEIPHSKSLGYYIAVIDENKTSTLRRNISIPEGSLLTVSFSFYILDLNNSTGSPNANFTLTFGKVGESNYSDLVLFDLHSQPVENGVWKHFKFEITNKKEMLDMELEFRGTVFKEGDVVIGLDNIGLEWMELINPRIVNEERQTGGIGVTKVQDPIKDEDGPIEVLVDVIRGFNATLAYRNRFQIVNSKNVSITLNF